MREDLFQPPAVMTRAANGPAAGRLRWLLPRLLLAVAAVLAYAAGLTIETFADIDLWGHVRFGGDIVNAGRVIRIDPYSFTSDRPWINHEWLSEVAMYAAYAAGGTPGLLALKVVVCLLAAAVVAVVLFRLPLSVEARSVLLLVAIIGMKPATGHIRPQIFSLLLCAVLFAVMGAIETGRSKAARLLPLVFVAWANLHGGWVVGAGTLAVWTGCFMLDNRRSRRERGEVLLAAVAAAAATLVTPYGFTLWTFLSDTVGFARPEIQDWQPITKAPLEVAAIWAFVCVSALVIAVRTRRTMSLGAALVTTMLGVASFRVHRIAPFFAESVALLLAVPLARAEARGVHNAGAEPAGDTLAAAAGVSIAAVCAMVIAAAVAVRNAQCIRLEPSAPDPEVAAFVRTNDLRGRMVTWFDWGEYAIWHFAPGVQVSMDGRRETVYSQAVIDAHLRLYLGRASSVEDMRRLDPDYIWLPRGLVVIRALRDSGWTPVFDSRGSVVLARPGEKNLYVAPSPAAQTPPAMRCFPGP